MQAHITSSRVGDGVPAPAPHGIREQIGAAIGTMLAPLVSKVVRVRKARMFHPEGQLFEGHFEATVTEGPYADLARRLGRTVLARLSGALSRNERERFEVLGIALRFHRGAKLSTRGVQPVGVVHAIRKAAYAASQKARRAFGHREELSAEGGRRGHDDPEDEVVT
jgi:hypothetical protein